MGRKRKVSNGTSKTNGPKEYDEKDARLGPVNTFEDLADSEEEYYMEQDRIMFDDGPKSKKQKRQEEEEAFLEENSDEEVLDYDDEGSDDEDDEDTDLAPRSKTAAKSKGDDAGSERGGGEEEDSGWWGSSRKEYYNADQIETEADALEEEKEALRLQKKKLSKMTEEDFIESEWLAAEPEEEEQKEVVTEVLKDIEIPEDMTTEERLQLLQARFPEVNYLADELLELQPLLASLQKEAEGQTRKSVAVVKYRVLGCYVATLAMYFATLTSPARDGSGTAKPMDPSELRDHEVMGTLLECREAWQKVKDMKVSKLSEATAGIPSPPEEEAASREAVEVSAKESKKAEKDKAHDKAKARKAKRAAKAIEDSIADLDGLLEAAKKQRKKKVKDVDETVSDDHSDFGEEESMDARAAADKAARKKSLRFYTSQIVQKANRRAGAGRDAGGDMDIPYRERLKDRQARLNAEAQRRGLKGAEGAELGGDDSDEEEIPNAAKENSDDEYYDMVAAKKKGEKNQKLARAEALAAASKLDRVVEKEEIGEDGKRKITYAIEKNKGLAPRRKKDVRNPRVKKRKKFAEKQKKLKSMKSVYSGGEGRGGYGGEMTGIKSGLVKSVKL